MSEQLQNPPHMQFQEVLAAVEQGGTVPLPIGEPRDNPFDTTFQDRERPSPMPEGVHDVREHLAEDFPGWQPDDMVRGTFTVTVNHRQGRIEAIAHSVNTAKDHLFNENVASFVLGGVKDFTPEQVHQLSMLGVRRLVGTIQVGPTRLIGIRHYSGTLQEVYAVEQPFDDNMEKLRHGEPVFVEGIVESYTPGKPTSGYRDDGPSVKLTQPDGRILSVSLESYRDISCGSSAIEAGGSHDLVPPSPIPGDWAQVASRFWQDTFGQPELDKIKCLHRASMHLLGASEARVDAEHAADAQLDHLIDIIGSVESQAHARKLIGHYIAGLLRIENDHIVSDLSEPHRQKLIASMKFDHPRSQAASEEWPMGLILSKDIAAPLSTEFGEEVLMMTPAEFQAFTLEVALGLRPTTNLAAGKALFSAVGYGRKELLTQVSLATITEFYDRFVTEKQTEPENQARDDYAQKMLTKALADGLVNIANENNVADRLVKLTRDAFGEQPLELGINQPLLKALTRSIIRCGEWDDSFVTSSPDAFLDSSQAQLIIFKHAYETYSSAMPELRAAISRANEAASYTIGDGSRQGPYDHWLVRIDVIMAKLASAVRT